MRGLWERLNPPDNVATAQRSWDRNELVYRLRLAGWTLERIAHQQGVTRERIRQREAKHLRDRHKRSPIERWLHGWRDELAEVMSKPRPVVFDIAEILRRARDVVERAAAAEEHRLYWEKQRAIVEEAWQRKAAEAMAQRQVMMKHEVEWRLDEALMTPEVKRLLRLINQQQGEK